MELFKLVSNYYFPPHSTHSTFTLSFPSFLLTFSTCNPPHFLHLASTGLFQTANLHFGNPLQAKNSPYLPVFISIGLPHLSHFLSLNFLSKSFISLLFS